MNIKGLSVNGKNVKSIKYKNNEINIGGNSCYHIVFDKPIYNTTGTITVSAKVLKNYNVCVGETVGFSSSASNYVTGITDNNGAVSVTITFSDSTILIASIGNANATVQINLKDYLFYDACDTTYDDSKYGAIIGVSSSTTTNYTAYDSTENAYLTKANGDWGCIPINALTGKDNYKLTAYLKPKSTSSHIYRCGFGFLEENTTSPFYSIRIQGNGDLTYCEYENSTESNRKDTHNLNVDDWHKMEITKQGNKYDFRWYDTDDETILVHYISTFDLTDAVIGLYVVGGTGYGGYVKEIAVEEIDLPLYNPLLDGTENITTISSYTPTISNNEMVNGCGYLTNGWDNTVDWELTFEYYTTGDNNGYLVIPQNTSQRDKNGIQQWYYNQLNFRVNGSSPSGNISNATSGNQWVTVRVTKIDYVWTVYYNNVLKTAWDTSSYKAIVDDWDVMCIGLDRNSNRYSAKIKNIKVNALND